MLVNIFVVVVATSSIALAYSEPAHNLQARDRLPKAFTEREAVDLEVLEHYGTPNILDKRYNRATPDTPIDPSILAKKGSVYTVDLSTFQAIIARPNAKQAYLVPNLRDVRNALLKLEGLMSNEVNKGSSNRPQDSIPPSVADFLSKRSDKRAVYQREAVLELEFLEREDFSGSFHKREARPPMFGGFLKKLADQKKVLTPPPKPSPKPAPPPPPQPSQPSAADQAKAKQEEQDRIKKAVESDRKARGVSTTTTTTVTTQNTGAAPADPPPDADLGAPLPDIPSLPPMLPVIPMSPYPMSSFPLAPAPLTPRPLYRREISEEDIAYAYGLHKRYAEAEARGGRLRRVGHAVGSAFAQLGGAIGNQMLDTMDPQAAQNGGIQKALDSGNQRRDIDLDLDSPFAFHERDAEAHEHAVDDDLLFSLAEREPEDTGLYEAPFEPELWF